MALPQIDENAGWLAGIVFLGSVLWKVWLRLKSDTRGDKAAAREHDAEGNVIGGYDQLIAQMRKEIDRLAGQMEEMSKALSEERRERYKAERLAHDLQERVEVLESRLRELGQTP